MLRKILISISVIALVALALVFVFVPPQVIEISEAQLDQGLEDNLPYQVDKGVLVTVQSATVELSDANKIIVTAEFDAAGLTLEGTGTAIVDSAIRYKRGKFYLSDLKHDNVTFEFSKNSNETISDVKSTLEGILRRETEEAEASEDPERIDQLARANAYYEEKLREDAVELLDETLATFPVYNLNRANGMLRIAALALEDVEISTQKIRITLSIQKLITALAGFVGLFLMFVFVFIGPENSSRLLTFLFGHSKKKSDPYDGADF